MSIVATAQPLATPPRVEIDLAVPAGNVMSSATVWRLVGGKRTLLRTQPAAGFDSRTIFDYECPFSQSVSYIWTVGYVAPAGTVFDELWANTSAWIVDVGSWAVSAGKVTGTGNPSGLYRSFAPGKYRTTISSAAHTGAAFPTFYFSSLSSLSFQINRQLPSGIGITYTDENGTQSSFLANPDFTHPVVVDFTEDAVTITATNGSWTIPLDMTLAQIEIGNESGTGTVTVGEIKVESYGLLANVTETSGPIVMDVENAWLIHPGNPSLSVELAQTDISKTTLTMIGDVANAASSTNHAILGTSKPITTTNGPRAADVTSISVRTYDAAHEAALLALLLDQTPILIQTPALWGSDFNSDFYSVGDVNRSKPSQNVHPYRDFDLPLTEVQSPVVDVENVGWSWASLAIDYMAWEPYVTDDFATWADLQIDKVT